MGGRFTGGVPERWDFTGNYPPGLRYEKHGTNDL
jgi:hypothetical protein